MDRPRFAYLLVTVLDLTPQTCHSHHGMWHPRPDDIGRTRSRSEVGLTTFVTRYDFRAPSADPATRRDRYALALEQAAYLDAHGQDALSLSEHHGSDDGYLPSPLVVASAMAAVTRRIPISVAALVVNLHDPIRLAEDVAVLDHVSGGRVTYTFGLGYRTEEYAMFGRPWDTRARDTEAQIRLLLRAWSGEPVTHEGRTARVTPTPVTRPHPVLFYGGATPAAARRAARLGLHFQPQVADRDLKDLYRAECLRHGRDPGLVLMPPPGPAFVFCAQDPDRFWAEHGHHLLADAVVTNAWHGDIPSVVRDAATTVDGLRAGGRYAVLTPGELVDRCRSREIRAVAGHPLCAGLPERPSWESLRLICEVVMPALRGSDAGPARADDPDHHHDHHPDHHHDHHDDRSVTA
jgi:alkanesulfonate monooxygenase SsuD/methylene tetrahydromethanopterin reductase-like flavin-dependent oxidoreductase (luciferase family)